MSLIEIVNRFLEHAKPRFKPSVLTLVGVLLSTAVFSQPSGYSFGKEITIQSSQVAGTTDFNNFPVLISVTDPNLATVANGGNVRNNSGYDIVFSTGCTALLSHQIESYNPATGQYTAWVRVPVLRATTNTIIYMYYGNPGVSANPSTTAVWDNNYEGVWHVNGNSFLDGTSNGNDATDAGTANLASAKIAGGRAFSPSTDRVEVPTAGMTASQGTISAWIYSTSFTTNHHYIFGHTTQPPYNNRIQIYTNDNAGMLDVGLGNNHASSSDVFDFNLNQWYHVTVTWGGGSYAVYVDGNPVSTGTYSGLSAIYALGDFGNNGNDVSGRTESWRGNLDELRVSSISRSANWILTEYRNQNTPASFYTFSSQLTAAATCALPVELENFEATPVGDNKVRLTWTTATEINNDYFTIERSIDGNLWNEVSEVKGAGNTNSRKHYEAVDHEPFAGVSYYRLRQTDFDNTVSYSVIRRVEVQQRSLQVFPNPAVDVLTIRLPVDEPVAVQLVNSLGQVVLRGDYTGDSVQLNTAGLSRGVYTVWVTSATYTGRTLVLLH